jgi:hypothetical protein
MAQLVGGFCLPHNPLITGAPAAPAAHQARASWPPSTRSARA